MKNNKKLKEIIDYDNYETSKMLKSSKPIKFEDLGLKLPDNPPTQVVSLRLPTALLNEIKAIGSQKDVPYQALIKLMLAYSLGHYK